MICSGVISRAFHTGEGRRRVRKCTTEGKKNCMQAGCVTMRMASLRMAAGLELDDP